MTLQFFCKVIAKEEDTYSVLVHSTDLSLLPQDNNCTIRKINTDLDISINDIVYVSDSILEVSEDKKKLTVKQAFKLSKIENMTPDILPVKIDEEIKKMILDSNMFPIDIFK